MGPLSVLGVQVPKFCILVAEVRGYLVSAHPAFFSPGAVVRSACLQDGECQLLQDGHVSRQHKRELWALGKGHHSSSPQCVHRAAHQYIGLETRRWELSVERAWLWEGGGHLSVCDHRE